MDGYWFNPYAMPNLVVGLGILVWGWFLRKTEAQSETGIWAFGVASSAAVWLLGFAAAYCSLTSTLAGRWISVAQAGVVVLAPMLYEFMSKLLGFSGWRKAITPIVWAIAAVFLILLAVTGDYLAPPYHYFWGFYAHYRLGGKAFAVYFVGVALFLSLECWRTWRRAPHGSVRRRRALVLLVGFGGGFLAAVDFIPALGIPVYSFGYLMAAFTVSIFGYASWRYQTISVTSEVAAEQILKTLSDGVLVLDEMGTIARLNNRGVQMIGKEANDLLGRRLEEVLPSMEQSIGQADAETRSPDVVSREIELLDGGGGNKRIVDVTVDTLRDRSGASSLTVLVLQDVTRYRNAIEKIQKLTYFDQATGLPNRRHLRARMDQIIKGSPGSNRFALGVLRVERVKRVLLGSQHAISPDSILMAVAQRLKEFLAATEARGIPVMAGILQGYDFAILFEDVEGLGQLSRLLSDALTYLRVPVDQGSIRFKPMVWLGVGLYPQDGVRPDELLERAIAAVDQAVSTKSENIHFYNDATNEASVRSLALSTRLECAIENRELEMHFQPVVNANSCQIEYAEALARWSDPLHGNCSPEEFIPVAEQSDLALALDQWALSEACAAAVRWDSPGKRAVPAVAVNLSGSHLNQVARGSLVGMVRSVLEVSGLTPDRLVLEITERCLVEAKEDLISELGRLREQGVRISMDDFGTGYASLSYLEWLPLDKLKIDRSFVTAIGRDARKTVILEAMLSLAKKLDLRVVAEGVEDPRQVDFLVRHGCEYLQGYLFSRPVPGEKFNELLQEWSIPRLSRSAVKTIKSA